MGNSLFDQFGGHSSINPFEQIIEEAQTFKKNFSGNPRDEVQKLLDSGRMSQSQFNQLMPIAQQIASMMPKR